METGRIHVVTDFLIKMDKLAILASIHCFEHNSAYAAMSVLYDNLVEVVREATPKAAFVLDTKPEAVSLGRASGCMWLMYCLVTLGDDLSGRIGDFFEKGLYAEGLLLDAMANHVLFDCSCQLHQRLVGESALINLALTKRLSPGEGQLVLSFQKTILEQFSTLDSLGVTMTDGDMLDPVKSLAYVYGADASLPKNALDHDCSDCGRLQCNLRQPSRPGGVVSLTVLVGDQRQTVVGKTSETLLTTLVAAGIVLNSPCGGRATCGKCRLKLLEGDVVSDVPVVAGGYLACRSYPLTDCILDTGLAQETAYQTMIGFSDRDIRPDSGFQMLPAARVLGLAIDIGTTTLVLSAVDLRSGKVLETHSLLNSQRKYGADVISRIQFGAGEQLNVLHSCIRADLLSGIALFVPEIRDDIVHVAIAGNTTMLHFLQGLSVESLGIYPFQPMTTDWQEYSFVELFSDHSLSCLVTILPGVSAFVGADIVAGLLHCGFASTKKKVLLIDVGTNGEIAVGNREKIVCLAAAAGPAFEGANIACGTGSVAGAISAFDIIAGNAVYSTIEEAEPVGICGSGVLDIVAASLRERVIDATGRFDYARYSDANLPVAQSQRGEVITFTQKDVREVQLAKSAIRSGLDVVLKRYGITYDDIDTVFLAGGFGAFLRIESATLIGMIPTALKSKVKTVGNSSLGGTIAYLLDQTSRQTIHDLLAVTTAVDLATDTEFNDLFLENLQFPTL